MEYPAHTPLYASAQKTRTTWFHQRATYPLIEANVEYLREQIQWARSHVPFDLGIPTWVEAGPTNMGGRATSLALDPRHPETVYLGAAGGGVWATYDAGRHWKQILPEDLVLSVGALALDPNDPLVIYCGTGEADGSAEIYPGVGIYQSEDGGAHWSLLADALRGDVPRRIGSIAVDPFDSLHIRAGGISFTDEGASGMYYSLDGGTHWHRQADFISAKNYWCHAVVFHPDYRDLLFATVDARGPLSGIWSSRDRGRNWTHVTRGLPPPENFRRTSLAIAPSDPQRIYALASSTNSSVLGVFRSDDAGYSWTSIGGHEFDHESQMVYNNCIAVSPEDPGVVICGGINLHVTRDGGRSWRRATYWNVPGTPAAAHADHHALLMPNAHTIYDANDGGMDFSDDAGRTWSNRSRGLAITMFYDADVAQSDGRKYGGGSQDVGTVITNVGRADEFTQLTPGDGGWMVYDPTDPTHAYSSAQHLRLFRLRITDGLNQIPIGDMSDAEHKQVWMGIIDIDPRDPSRVIVGTTRVWQTVDDGDTWLPISPVLDNSPITALEISRADSHFIYAGTQKGNIFKSDDGGATWSPNLAGPELPGRIVTRIQTAPDDPEKLFLTVGTVNALKPFGHVFRSCDGGRSWTDVDRGRLPNVPFHSIAFQTDDPGYVYFASDAGVYAFHDGAQTWSDITGNLPNVMVTDLVYHDRDRTLTAATYGRSLWRLSLRS